MKNKKVFKSWSLCLWYWQQQKKWSAIVSQSSTFLPYPSFNRPNFSRAQWDFVKQFLFEYLPIWAVKTLGEGRNLGEIQLVVFWPGTGSSECSYTGCTRMSISHWLTLIDILVHPIYEHSDEESKIFALRYIMVISHTKVNRQLNIGMIVGFDMSFLFTDEKPIQIHLWEITLLSLDLFRYRNRHTEIPGKKNI